ncbi:MAG: ROK family protein [Frankiales bacterium]|nr:ROK family protein [Frankiales bacterium]
MRLGVDIGGTKTAAVVLGDDGEVRASATAPSGRGADDVVARAVDLALRVLESAGPDGVRAAGACIPGLVDPVAGTVRHAVNLDVEELDLAGALAAGLGMPVLVENDVKAAALGAHHLAGLGAGLTLAYLNLGTGLAAAVVHAGDVVRGVDGVAGEIGHLPVGGSTRCACGQTGCLETLASGSALVRMWPQAPEAGWDVLRAAERGDDDAARAAAMLCSGIALAVQVLVLASGAQRVVMSGGLTLMGEPLLEAVRAEQRRRAAGSPLLASLRLDEKVSLLASDVPVAAIGAARLGVAAGTGGAPWRS